MEVPVKKVYSQNYRREWENFTEFKHWLKAVLGDSTKAFCSYCHSKIIVHLDLKGAPLKLQYLDKVLECVKQWGATGVLLEWEDTFPYSGDLSMIGSIGGSGGDEMYTMEEVQKILQSIKERGLEPIQLVQTIGHMEFVLKHPPFRELREDPRSPAVLCPSKAKSQHLVREMLQNALDAQPDAKYFHIGADEVWHTGVCEDCKRRAARGEHKSLLFLDYISDVLVFLKTLRPKLNILMWDDMLRTINLELLEKSNIGKMVEPVVWNYNVVEHFYIGADLWRTYNRVFPKLWAGSAYKGANGSCQALSPVGRYTSNQAAWIRELQRNSDINFTGIILTGWSRFDHYATLCELLPAAMPSLYSCLSVWIQPTAEINDVTREVLPEQSWPGLELARCVHSFVLLRERANQLIHGDAVSSWLNPWQVERGYSSPVQVDAIAATANELLTNLQCLQREVSVQLKQVTGRRSAGEWVGTHLTPLLGELTRLQRVAARSTNSDASVAPLPQATHEEGSYGRGIPHL